MARLNPIKLDLCLREFSMGRKHGDGEGLKCPVCSHGMIKTLETRKHRKTNCRRRECQYCGENFWTVEIYASRNGDILEMVHPEDYE